ncbi:MAG: SAM-dependent methyltransferase [Defluviitaleaceae bacterium]|nr:SAM-dependent methyltransferase [Defluviitaleaceae bacterium]
MLPDTMLNHGIYKIVLSKPKKGSEYVRAEILQSRSGRETNSRYQIASYTATQVFHSNHDYDGICVYLAEQFGVFLQYNAWDDEYEYSARVSKKGKVLCNRRKTETKPRRTDFEENSFNRRKNHIIKEGTDIPALVDMGVFTRELKVAAPMWDKFQQINRFLEILADETDGLKGETINIIDFGCGKSYLTFVVYHYFSQIKKLRTNICGLDINADVVKKCTEAATKYGYAVTFRVGDIGTLNAPPIESWGAPDTFNIVISLHACDTATDHALYNAVRWQADLITAVPCCQHELRSQMSPRTLTLLNDYGIIKERIASLATDAIRAKLLEAQGYKTQIIELTDMEHTAKNLLIRAKRITPHAKSPEKMSKITPLVEEFGFSPLLLRLFSQ